MPENYTRLLEVLKEQSAAVQELIELGLAETAAFKRDDVPQIISIVDRQKDAVNRMWRLEQLKAGIIDSIRDQLPAANLEPEQVFDDMGEIRNEIEATGDQLVALARRLQEINETNRLLARMSLSFARMAQRALGIVSDGYDASGEPYGASGWLGKLNTSA